MSNELRKTIEFCFNNIDKLPAATLAKTINPHVAEIRQIVSDSEVMESCLQEMA